MAYRNNLKNVNPKDVLKKYPWLNEKNQDMVIHNDIDGILTALTLHEFLGWNVVGLYDLEKIWLIEDYKGSSKDLIYVDLDVTIKGHRSIGHHIVDVEDDTHINANNLFGVDYNRFREKCPISTALLLHWIYGKKYPDKPLAKLFLAHADSLWENYKGYTNNVTNWLNRLNMTELVTFLKDKRMEEAINKYVIPKTVGWNHQCNYIVKNGKFVFKESSKDVQAYVDSLANMLGYSTIQLPTNFVEKITFQRKQVEIPDKNFKEVLDNLKKDHKIFSHSLKYWDKLDLSYSV